MEVIGWILGLGFAAFAALIFHIALLDVFYTETSTEKVLVKNVQIHYHPVITKDGVNTNYRVTVVWNGVTLKYDSKDAPFIGDTIEVRITRGKLFGWFAVIEQMRVIDDMFEDTPIGFDSPNDWWDSLDEYTQNSLAAKVKKSSEYVTDDEIIFLFVTEYEHPNDYETKSFRELKSLRANSCKVAVEYMDKDKMEKTCTVIVPIIDGVSISHSVYTKVKDIHIIRSYVILEYYDGAGNIIIESNGG